MIVFRPVAANDLDAIYQLATKAGVGLTTLPLDKTALQQRIVHSELSFKRQVAAPLNENYFFVLEDSETKAIIGTSAIDAAVGYELPFYSYRLSKISRICHEMNMRVDYELLNCVNDFQGFSEIGTLFLDKNYRKNQNGLLLSRARFLFMAEFVERFAPCVIAEMRGVSDSHGESPFWNDVGRHFFQIDFAKADRLSALTNKQFIADLLPRHPIYINMLSEQSKAVIGKPHQSTVAAMKILEKEGFYYNHYVDIFDAGPTLKCHLHAIASVKNSQTLSVSSISDSVHATACFVANTTIDYRAVTAEVMINDTSCIIDSAVAKALNVDVGSQVRIVVI